MNWKECGKMWNPLRHSINRITQVTTVVQVGAEICDIFLQWNNKWNWHNLCKCISTVTVLWRNIIQH